MGAQLSELIYVLAQKTRFLGAAIAAGEPSSDLTNDELLILDLLSEKGDMNISDIYKHFKGKAFSTISGYITILWTKKGLLEKTIDPSNQRVRIIRLTEKGREKLLTVRARRIQVFSAIIEALDFNEKEEVIVVNAIGRALPKMDKKIEQMLKSGSSESES